MPQTQIKSLYQTKLDFLQSESALIAGHQMHLTPKSCTGFSEEEFCQYYPEFKQNFSFIILWLNPIILYFKTNLKQSSDTLIKQYFVSDRDDHAESLIPLHPWQSVLAALTSDTTNDYLGGDLLIDLEREENTLAPVHQSGVSMHKTHRLCSKCH